MRFLVLLLLAFPGMSFAQNTRVPDFNNAKKIIKQTSYLGVTKEIYCGCVLKPNNKFDATACGYVPKNNNERAHRIEQEHIVPFENIVGHTPAWDYGVPECKGKKGRACAGKVYGHIEGDLWNLLPSIGELNGLRSNYTVAEIPGEERRFGKCDFEVSDKKMEPPEEMKPVIAVTYKYMQMAYGKKVAVNLISNKNENLLEVWGNKPLPVWACQWGKRVSKIQGNDNPFLIAKCKSQGVW